MHVIVQVVAERFVQRLKKLQTTIERFMMTPSSCFKVGKDRIVQRVWQSQLLMIPGRILRTLDSIHDDFFAWLDLGL